MKFKLAKLLVLITITPLVVYAQSQVLQLYDTCWFRNGPNCANVKSLALAPSNPDVIYLGTYSAGIYRTRNAGASWSYCSTENLSLYEDTLTNSLTLPCWWFGDYYPIDAIAVNPIDENHLWISTLERGLFESTNGGDNWQKANESLPDTLAVNFIHINPQDPDDILLGTGKYFTPSSPQNGGLYRTLNAGYIWELIESIPHGNTYHISDIKRDPNNNDYILIGISSGGESGFSWGLIESYDNGNTWKQLIDDFPVYDICINPNNNQNLWGIVYTAFQDYFLFRSDDGGQSWSLFEGFDDPYKWVTSLYADVDFNLYIDRDKEETTGTEIKKSTDNGNSWLTLDNLPGVGGIGFQNRFEAESSNSDFLYYGTYLGMYSSKNGGITAQLLSNNLMNSYIFDLEVQPNNHDVVYAAGSQGLWKSVDGGFTWENIIRDRIRVVKCNPIHPDTIYFGGRNLWRSYDGGTTYQEIVSPLFNTLTDIAINPEDENILYYKVSSGESFYLYRSTDYGDTWQFIFTDYINNDYREIIIDPLHPDTLYTGKFRSIDGGDIWEEHTNKLIIAVHPQNSNTIYATDGVFQDDHNTIEVSYNWGKSFQTLAEYHNGPFPNYNIYCFRIDKENPEYMFYSTRNSKIFYSVDAGNSWQQLNGKYNNRVTDIIPIIDKNKYYVSSHGDGVWVYDTSYVSVIDDYIKVQDNAYLSVSPNPFKQSTSLCFNVTKPSHVNISVYDIQGKLILTLTNENKVKGKYITIWDGKDKNGKEVKPGLYLVRLQSGRNIHTCKVILFK